MKDLYAPYRKDHDAFGHALMDYFEQGESSELIERGDGFVDVSSPNEIYFAPFEQWRAHEQDAVGELVSGRVLDLGCGAGRVELALQERGFEVVGIDISPLAVEVCRRRGVKDARVLPVTLVSRELGVFDNIVMLGNNWGLMGSRERAKWLLRRFYGLTTPGARIIAESNDIYKTTNPMHLAYQALNRSQGRMSGQIRMRVLYQLYRTQWFDYLMVSKEEMIEILEGTGWRARRFIESGGSVYVAVLEKEPRPR